MHKDDKAWILGQLNQLPEPLIRQYAMRKYNEAFDFAYKKEKLSHRKTGKARSYANNKLRNYVINALLAIKERKSKGFQII